MKHGILVWPLALVLGSACGSSEDEPASSTPESLVDALVRAVRFENGRRRDGDIARFDSAADAVRLETPSPVRLSPGDAMLMPLEVASDADDPPEATLLQFAGADSHTEVPIPDDAEATDAGAAGSAGLHVDNGFEVLDDVCSRLCNQTFNATLRVAVRLQSGAVSRPILVAIELDCRGDGDAAYCSDGGETPGPAPSDDSGVPTAGSGSGDAATLPDAATSDASQPAADGSVGTDAGMLTDGGSAELPPQIGPIVPETTTADTALTLEIHGQGFTADTVAYVDGTAVATSFRADTLVEADIPATLTANAGSLVVYVENTAGNPSNVLYLQVTAVAGAPVIWDYSPDNGVAGDTIMIIASNLAGHTLTIEGEGGSTLQPGTLSTISWPTAGTVDTVEVVLPDDIATGPITLSSELGSYRGKIFSVGLNLTRASGTVVESSTEYNTSNWSRVSGADNLLATSFFTANGDCATDATCTSTPWFQVTFASTQRVGRIAMRGNREYASGYDFVRGTFEVLGTGGNVLWEGTYDLPAPDRDLDITLPAAVTGASTVRFTSLEDESTEPGFAELEVFAR